MYRIIQTTLNIKTGELKISKNLGREEYQTYEECVERIEKFLVPHSIELGIFDDVDYNKGVEITYEDGLPVQWKVLRLVGYHTIFTIEHI